MTSSYNLGPYYDGFVRKQVASGKYQNASEVLRAALRKLDDEERVIMELRKLIQEGIDSGVAGTASEVTDQVRRKLRSRRRKAE